LPREIKDKIKANGNKTPDQIKGLQRYIERIASA
jgi:hypothetical protein